MVQIILVDTFGKCVETQIKKFNKDELYKKCNFRKQEGFEIRHTWKVKFNKNNYNIEVWARDNGRANQENKYELPPPVDSDLYFGKLAIVAYLDDSVIDLTENMWNNIYNELMGGFEDLQNTAIDDDNESDELENIKDEYKTDHGYLKDGFVVNDEELEDVNGDSSSEYYEGSELDEEEYDDEYSDNSN